MPEITTRCWSLVGKRPGGDVRIEPDGGETTGREPVVLPCTLLPYDPAFEMGETLAAARGPIRLNHPHCARFCILGGASCSGH